jgi:hypothetical protein
MTIHFQLLLNLQQKKLIITLLSKLFLLPFLLHHTADELAPQVKELSLLTLFLQ